MSILLEVGERGLMLGQTGSGKTTGAIFQLQHCRHPFVIVLDTKGEPAFNDLRATGNESTTTYESIEDFIDEFTRARYIPDYLIVRPTPEEMEDPQEMDYMLRCIYDARDSCLVYIDEAYQCHNNGRPGAGLIGLLTRGRSLGISTLLSSQRPAWISRFCFSESQKFYIYKLSDKRDRKTIADNIPEYDINLSLDKHNFCYYNNASESPPSVYAPVPMPVKARKTIKANSSRNFFNF